MRESLESPGSVVMSHAATLLGGFAMAGMAFATWRAADIAVSRNADALDVQNRRHQEVVASIESLAEKAGVLTSADLCPARFRLRCGDGHMVPRWSPRGILAFDSGSEFVYVSDVSANSAGTIDFGLIQPGRYRLAVHMPDGMHLQHEFDVLPGVPVDRLITCPLRSAPLYKVQLELEWPEPVAAQQLLAICRIQPAFFRHGGWTWRPANALPCLYALTDNRANEPLAFDSDWLIQSAPVSDDIRRSLQPGDEMSTTFRYCRLKEVTFLRRTGGGPEVEILGTAIFAGERDAVESQLEAAVAWYSETPAPWFDLGFEPYLLSIQLPDDIVERLLNRIQNSDATYIPDHPISRNKGEVL